MMQDHSAQDDISTTSVCEDEELNLFYGRDLPRFIFSLAKFWGRDDFRIILHKCTNDLPNIKEKAIQREECERCDPEELNIQGLHGETGLHHAVRHQHVEAARFLLEEGANPNYQTKKHFAPLHLAAYFQHEEMCQLLLSFGANVNPNLYGLLNPLSLVCGDSHASFYLISEVSLYNYVEIDYENLQVFNPKIMKILLKSGADPDSLDQIRKPILFNACQFGQLEAVKILLEFGANIRALDEYGSSALHYAARGKSFETVDFLLEKGLDIDFQNNYNQTPLNFVLPKFRLCREMIKYLVYRGANINTMNIKSESSFHFTVHRDDLFDEMLLFLELGADLSTLNIPKTFNGNNLSEKYKILIPLIVMRGKNELRNRVNLYFKQNREASREKSDYLKKSELEMTKLRTTTISRKCKISFFDFLTKDFYTSVQIAKNSDLRAFLNSNKHKTEFPCYEKLLTIRFERAKKFENSVDKTFDFIFNYTNLLPEIVEMIVCNLRSIDFRFFGKVLSNE